MEKREVFVWAICMVIIVLFAVLSILPIFGPSFGAYVLGFNQYRHKKKFGFSQKHSLISITLGELIFFVISSLIIKYIIEFYNPIVFWNIIIISFSLNYLLSITLYFWGKYKYKVRI